MKEYILEIDYPYFIVLAGVLLLAIVLKLFSKALKYDEDNLAKLFYIPIIIVVVLSFVDICISRTSHSIDEKLISNVWNVLIKEKKVPDLKIIAIADDASSSRYKITLINDEVYYVSYEIIDYKTLRIPLKAFKKLN